MISLSDQLYTYMSIHGLVFNPWVYYSYNFNKISVDTAQEGTKPVSELLGLAQYSSAPIYYTTTTTNLQRECFIVFKYIIKR